MSVTRTAVLPVREETVDFLAALLEPGGQFDGQERRPARPTGRADTARWRNVMERR